MSTAKIGCGMLDGVIGDGGAMAAFHTRPRCEKGRSMQHRAKRMLDHPLLRPSTCNVAAHSDSHVSRSPGITNIEMRKKM